MKRKKPELSQQWERLMRQREETIAKLVRIETKAAKLRKSLARRTNERAKIVKWEQAPLPDPALNDLVLGV
jgi:hypothetical protein